LQRLLTPAHDRRSWCRAGRLRLALTPGHVDPLTVRTEDHPAAVPGRPPGGGDSRCPLDSRHRVSASPRLRFGDAGRVADRNLAAGSRRRCARRSPGPSRSRRGRRDPGAGTD